MVAWQGRVRTDGGGRRGGGGGGRNQFGFASLTLLALLGSPLSAPPRAPAHWSRLLPGPSSPSLPYSHSHRLPSAFSAASPNSLLASLPASPLCGRLGWANGCPSLRLGWVRSAEGRRMTGGASRLTWQLAAINATASGPCLSGARNGEMKRQAICAILAVVTLLVGLEHVGPTWHRPWVDRLVDVPTPMPGGWVGFATGLPEDDDAGVTGRSPRPQHAPLLS